MADNSGRVKKVSGYAKRVFFNSNIEYRDFSDGLVGLQLTSEGGATLFTMGNFSVTTNLDPTPSKTFNIGTFSDYFSLDSISSEDSTFLTIEGNLETQLNLDITNPLHYVWYGNFNEFVRVSLNNISENWAAAIYVDNKVGSISGDNITNYSYDPISDTSTFTLPTRYFVNPYGIRYTTDASFVHNSEELETLRNLTVNYQSYNIDVDGTEFTIKDFTASTTSTNDIISVTVSDEAFPNITATTGSQPYFIKPNEQQRENFFSGLDEFQRNIVNRLTSPIYTVDLSFPEETDSGTIVFTNTKFSFPVLDDGYNLNFFDGLYRTYMDELSEIAENFDSNQTNLMIRKYTAEVINSFDSAPRCDGDDLVNDGAKATALLNIYGREYDEIKKYINGLKYAHVVTYNKKDNVPDSLVKDLSWMLGFDKINFLGDIDLTKSLLPSNGYGSVSGTSRNLTLREIDLELYRRVILNIAWLWKSKGARKAIEFLFRFIGAPEMMVVFDEHVYVADKPLDVEQVKRMLYLYTGEVDISKLPFDENGYPLPPVNGDLRPVTYIDISGNTTTEIEDMYYQKGGGWYRETGGANAGFDTNSGNNPHVGPYDAGSEYINYFTSECFIPGYTPTSTVFTAHTRIYENLFINYNNGFINGMPTTFDLYASPLTLGNQKLEECINLTSVIDNNCPALSGGTGPSNILEELCINAKIIYDEWVLKIKEEPYLRYSPEWEIIKRNNEIARANYFDNVNSVKVCDENSCLEICVSHFETEDINPCDEWVLVSDDTSAPFIYFTDVDGNKVLFDEFPVCCVANGGVFNTFAYQNGREACYCATAAPCNGLVPNVTGNDGIVVWEQTDGNTNTPVIVFGFGKDEVIWYNLGYKNSSYEITPLGQENEITPDMLFSSTSDELLKWEKLGYIKLHTYRKPPPNRIIGKDEWVALQKPPVITEVSPECCVWYGYEFIVTIGGAVQCIDKSTDEHKGESGTNTRVIEESLVNIRQEWLNADAKFGTGSPQAKELGAVYETRKTLYDNFNGRVSNPDNQLSSKGEKKLDGYKPYGNLNGGEESLYRVVPNQYNRLNKAVYLKSSIENTLRVDFNSIFTDPDSADCTVWEPKVDQKTGFVSFHWVDDSGANLVLPETTELFSECCKSKGYEKQCFIRNEVDGSLIKVDCGGKEVPPPIPNSRLSQQLRPEDNTSPVNNVKPEENTSPVNDVKPEENTSPVNNVRPEENTSPVNNVRPDGAITTVYINKCVDPDFILCDEIEDVKIVLPANEWNGFYLPKEVDGECKIEVSLDMMIKYDADALCECAFKDPCGLHLTQHDNSLYDLDCMNWITFTDYDDVLDDLSNNIQIIDINQIIEWEEINPDYVSLNDFNSSQFVPHFDDINITVWQTPGLQAEPDPECCNALGGVIVSKELWTELHKSEIKKIKREILRDDPIGKKNTLNGTIMELVDEYKKMVGKLDCVDIPNIGSLDVNCNDFDFATLITTQNVCHLPIPLECGKYSYTIEIYWKLINQLELAINTIEDCIERKGELQSILTALEAQQIDLAVEIESHRIECNTIIKDLGKDLEDCEDILKGLKIKKSKIKDQIKGLGDGKFDITTASQLALLNQQLINVNSQIIEQEQDCSEIITKIKNTEKECTIKLNSLLEEQKKIKKQISELNGKDGLLFKFRCCTPRLVFSLRELMGRVVENREELVKITKECYEKHNTEREENYQIYLESIQKPLFFIDDLEICLTLEVDNNIGEPVDLNNRYLTLPEYTTNVWSFDPFEDYTGIIIDGNPVSVSTVTQMLFQNMRDEYGDASVTENTFKPNWQHATLPLTDYDLRQLKTKYPNRPFFIGVAIKGFECGVCVLIDNIQINIETDEIERKFSMENCPSFDLRCVVDNKKSWVFSDGGVTEFIDMPGVGKCNLDENDNSKKIITYTSPQERLWLDLEYRHTDYEVNHEQLVINSKETTFRIDASKSIECDVYDFWKGVDCTTSACTGTSSDCVITGYTSECHCVSYTTGYTGPATDCITCPDGYTLESDNVTCIKEVTLEAEKGKTFYKTISGNTSSKYGFNGARIYEPNNNTPLWLTSDITFVENDGQTIVNVDATNTNSLWEERLNNVGVWTSPFSLEKRQPIREWIGFSHCIDILSAKTYSIGMAADNGFKLKVNGSTFVEMDVDSKFTYAYWHIFTIDLQAGKNIIEMEGISYGSTASFGAEIYDVTYSDLSAMTTTNQLSGVTIFTTEDYRSDNGELFETGEESGYFCPNGFALSKCKNRKARVYECVQILKETATPPCSGVSNTFEICTTEDKYIEVNPLDYLDKDPSEVNTKSDMDAMVVTNLIDVKSRQVLGGYPLLWAFYELYLNADNCGKDLSGHLNYNNLFEFTDLIGDYWLDLLEQVIPATTIMDGCSNSGKVYRNTIFDQPKHSYKRYALNYFSENTDGALNGTNCTLEGVTSESIGEERLCIDLTETIIRTGGETLNTTFTQRISLRPGKFNVLIPSVTDFTMSSFGVSDIFVNGNQTTINNISSVIPNVSFQGMSTNSDDDLTIAFSSNTSTQFNLNFVVPIDNADTVINSYNKDTVYNKVFITQIYDTNEYEGDITIVGDDEWDKLDELLHDCSEQGGGFGQLPPVVLSLI